MSIFRKLGIFFIQLSIQARLFLIFAIILGSAVRYSNLFNLGFVFDTVTTQYDWAKNAYNMGVGEFWRSFGGFFDYWPGSLYLLTDIFALSRFFDATPQAFVTILKSLNWIADIAFILFSAHIAGKYGFWTRNQQVIYAGVVYMLPALWFVGGIWGQFDSLLVTLSLASVVLLFSGVERKSNKLVLISGLIIGIAFWVKLQVFLLFPPLILFFILNKRLKDFVLFASGGFLSGFLMILIPLLTNWSRLYNSVLTPFTRDNNVSEGAATFWVMLGYNHLKGDIPLIGGITLSTAGFLIFVIAMIVALIRFFNIDLSTFMALVRHPVQTIRELLVRSVNFSNFVIIMTISSSAYFLFFTKMHSRYLHFGLLFGIISLATLRLSRNVIPAFFGIFLMSTGYFLNQAYIFYTSSLAETKLDWLSFFGSSDPMRLIGLLHVLGFVLYYAFTLNQLKSENTTSTLP